MKTMKMLSAGAAMAALLLGSGVQAEEDMTALATKYACLACHKIDSKLVGPAYKDVAAKYAGADEATIKGLEAKVKGGGSGVWGPIPMPPNAAVPEADISKLVKWVLSQTGGTAPAAAPAPAATK